MRNRILVQLLAIGMQAVLPLMLIQSPISERSHYHGTVVVDLARSYSNAQTLNAPLPVIPYGTGQWRTIDEKSGRNELECG